MGRLKEFFRSIKGDDWNGKLFLPVVRVKLGDEIKTGHMAAQVALNGGADGIFLTSHEQTPYHTLTGVVTSVIESLAEKEITFPVGVRYPTLSQEPETSIYEATRFLEIPLIWGNGPHGRERIETAIKNCYWGGFYFATIAPRSRSKNKPRSLSAAAREAAWADAIVVGGNFADGPAGIERAHILAKAVPNSVRVLSGRGSITTIENVLPHFDAFIVNQLVSLDKSHLDPRMVSKTSSVIRAFQEGETE